MVVFFVVVVVAFDYFVGRSFVRSDRLHCQLSKPSSAKLAFFSFVVLPSTVVGVSRPRPLISLALETPRKMIGTFSRHLCSTAPPYLIPQSKKQWKSCQGGATAATLVAPAMFSSISRRTLLRSTAVVAGTAAGGAAWTLGALPAPQQVSRHLSSCFRPRKSAGIV